MDERRTTKIKLGMRLKITLAFCLFALLIVTVGAILGYWGGMRLLSDTIVNEQMYIAKIMADFVDKMFNEEINYIKSFSDSPFWKEAIADRNGGYRNMHPEEIDRYLNERDAKWVKARDNDPLIREYLDNMLSSRLIGLAERLDHIGEIMVTDRYGGLVAASNRTTDFYQADEKWWQEVFDGGKGRVFFGKIELDVSSNTIGIPIAMPIEDKGDIVGICKVVVDIHSFLGQVGNIRFAKTGRAFLTDDEGYILFMEGLNPLSKKLLSKEDFNSFMSGKKKWILSNDLIDTDKRKFIAFQKIRNPFLLKDNIQLNVFVEQLESEAFAPLHALMLQFLIVMATLVTCIVFSGSYIGGRLSRSIIKLKRGVERIDEGNMDYRVEINTGDEVEELGDSFNKMVEHVKESRETVNHRMQEANLANANLRMLMAQLKEANAELVRLRNTLERKVEGRTKELQTVQAAVMNIMEDLQESRDKLEASNAEIMNTYEQLKKTQTQLVWSEKMAALGRFSAGIAHEVKNPLAIILTGMEVIEAKLPPGSEDMKSIIQKIKEAVSRADTILHNLLRFGTPSTLETETVNLKDLVSEAINLFKYKSTLVNIDIKAQFIDEGSRVMVDKGQLQQVLFNLLLNSIDAMPKGGTITVKTYKTDHLAAPSKTVPACAIEIVDTGEGISEENLKHVFEPFFTTKRDDKGTGLGLVVARSIIENLKGTLVLESELGKGTAARIVLPCAKA